MEEGDEYHNTVNYSRRVFVQGIWAAVLGASIAELVNSIDPLKGAGMSGYDGGTVRDILDGVKTLAEYTVLRGYTGRATGVRIAKPGIAGDFYRDITDTTSADNGGTIIVDGAGRRWKRRNIHPINVLWFGAKGDGVTDDYVALLAAANAVSTGGTLLFPPGFDFVTRSGIPLSSHVTVIGFGSKISALDPGFTTVEPGKHLFHNKNFGSGTILDESIKVIGIETDYKTISSGHSIGFKNARNVQALFNTFKGGSNGTTFRACEDTKAIGNTATGQTNCCFDHWDNVGDIVVIGNTADSSLADQGIQVTGDGDYPPGPSIGASTRVTFSSNIVKNIGKDTGSPTAATGVIINAIQSGSNVIGGSISGNIVDGCGLGIALHGAISGVSVSANQVSNCSNRSIKLGANSAGEKPSNCSVTGNTVSNSAAGVMSPYSLDGTGHSFSGNTCDGVGGYGYALKLIASNCVLGVNNLPAGSSGVIESLGSGNRLELSASYTPSLTFGGASAGITYSSRSGRMELNGKLLFVEAAIVLSSKGTATGNAQVSLPAGFNAAVECVVGVARVANMQSGVTGLTGTAAAASSLINIGKQGANGLVAATDADFANNTNIVLSGTLILP